ncbi:MAG: hypothetical protein HQK73_04440 [Desulfamplus sp.]|nr:hypothetical protein [Desulfamplus sp.]
MKSLRFFSSMFLASLLLSSFFIQGCSQFINRPLSAEYIAGKKLAEIYAKQDAIDSHCIDYPVSLSSNILNNTKRHVNNFKDEKSSDFINGFSKSYEDEYREYMSLYCDSLDSSQEYIK